MRYEDETERATCPNHGVRLVLDHDTTMGPDPWATERLDCGCELLDVGDGPIVLGCWSNMRRRAVERAEQDRPDSPFQVVGSATYDEATDSLTGFEWDPSERPDSPPMPSQREMLAAYYAAEPPHHRSLMEPCAECGAEWQPSAIEDGSYVIVHRDGCQWFEPGLDLNEHVVGRDEGHASIKALAVVLGWIAVLMLVVWVPLQHGRIERARACRHAVVESPHLVGLDYHDGAWWRPDGRLVAFAPSEDSPAYELKGCDR